MDAFATWIDRLAIRKARRPRTGAALLARSHAGFTLIELLTVVGIVGIVAAIAAPSLMRARMSGNESAAIGSTRSINSAQFGYAVACGAGSYALTYPQLAIGPAGSVGFLSPELSSVAVPVKSGYVFGMAAGFGAVAGPPDCNGSPSQTAYYATAVPTNVGSTGVRGFATNQSGAIWQDVTGIAPAEPFVLGPGVSPVQ